MQIKDKIISMEVIPSKKDTWFGEPYYEVETVNYTDNHKEWLKVYMKNMVEQDYHGIFFKKMTYLSAADAYMKSFNHYATAPILKVNSTKLYEIKSKVYTKEEFAEKIKTKAAENEILHSINIIFENQDIDKLHLSDDEHGYVIRSVFID